MHHWSNCDGTQAAPFTIQWKFRQETGYVVGKVLWRVHARGEVAGKLGEKVKG